MLNADGSKRRWTMEDAKQMFDKCGAKKPDNATWDILDIILENDH